MGFSAHPSIIIGIESSEIVDVKNETETYEVHDQKGKKTGQMGKELTTTFSAIVNGKERTSTYGAGSSSISDLLDIEDSPNNGKFGVIDSVYEGNHTLESCVVGIPIVSLDIMYGKGSEEIGASDISDAISAVKIKCKEMFNKEVEPKVFLFGNASY